MTATDFFVREARLGDAKAIARVYIDSWRDTYPGILPLRALAAMDDEQHAARWRSAIAMPGRECVLVVENNKEIILGMTSFGRSRDAGMGFDGEIYTLYVEPASMGKGIGRALLRAAFEELAERELKGCIIWAHAQNPARYFYEAMGGKLLAERVTSIMGTSVPEAAFGWKSLVLAEASRTR